MSFPGRDETSFLYSTEYVWVGSDPSTLIGWLYRLTEKRRQGFCTLMLTTMTPLKQLQIMP